MTNNLNQMIQDTLNKKIQELSDTSIFISKPPTPKEFFNDWLKQPAYPIQQEAIDSILLEERDNKELHWSSKYNEAYLLWGEGGGKDWTSAGIMVLALCYLTHLKSPQAYFGFTDPKSAIDLVNVSFDEEQAQNVYFKYLKKMLSSTINPKTGKKWFEEQGMKIKETSKTQMIEFPKYITCYSLNSREYKAEGKNVIMSIFDEMAVFKVAKAKELYDNLKGSMKSRFPKEHKLIAISYKRDDYDYMMIRWDETKNDPKVFRSGPYATWDVNLRVKKEDFQDVYVTNPEDAERRYECKGSTLKSGYFKYRDKIKENINKNRVSPILEDVVPVRSILKLNFHDWFVGKPNGSYNIHIDLATGKEGNDCAGFGMGHLEPTEDENKPKIFIDLMFQIKAEPGKEIIFEDIRQFIYVLQSRVFTINKVTLDGWQSIDFLQMLKSNKIESDVLSMDRDTIAYDTLKSLIYQGREDYYGYPVFIRECEELILINGKVDHPEISRRRALEEKDERGSKDVSDAVAGVTYSLLKTPAKPKTSFRPLTHVTSFDKIDTKGSPVSDENKREYGSNYNDTDDETDDDD